MKIKHLRRNEIDDFAWDASISKASNRRIYALSWYLDLVTNGRWDALVADDYSYLFPLPLGRPWFWTSQVQRPILCQQLGLFGPSPTTDTLQAFLAAIPRRYWRVYLPLNAQNKLENLPSRVNLELSLDLSLEEIRKSYGKSLRKRVRRAGQQLHFREADSLSPTLAIYRAVIGDRLGWSDQTYQRVEHCLEACLQRKKAKVYEVVDEEGDILASGCFLLGFDRVINVLGAATPAGMKQYATHFLLDQVIETHHVNCSVFDFEGSELPGVGAFFRSYGAKEVPYYTFERGLVR